MAELTWFIFSSGGAVTSLLVCALWRLVSPASVWARRGLLAVAAFYWLSSTYAIPHTASRVISAGYRPLTRPDVAPGTTTVVVLGSGTVEVRDWSDRRLAVPELHSASRLVEAARVFGLLNATQLISSGGHATPGERVQPSGRTMADALLALGIPADRLLVETESANTRDEAVVVSRMLRTHPTDHVVLVTSRVHMRRSIGVFRAVGIDAIPAIARDPATPETLWGMLFPTDKGLREAALTAHEVLGLVAYSLRGWYRY